MSNLNHYKSELQRAGLLNEKSVYDGMLGNAVLELVEVFTKQGHSGASAHMTVDIFNKLINENILTPLTGDDSEWCEITRENGKPLYQNNRRSSVFKDDKEAYDIDGGPIFKDIKGGTYTCRESILHNITFPYSPKEREILDDYELIKKQRITSCHEFFENTFKTEIEPKLQNDNNYNFKWTQLVTQELLMWASLATWENTITTEDFNYIITVRGFDEDMINYIKRGLNFMEITIKGITP